MSQSVVFGASLSLMENWGRLTCRAPQPQEQRCPFLLVCAVFFCDFFFFFFFLGGHLSEIFLKRCMTIFSVELFTSVPISFHDRTRISGLHRLSKYGTKTAFSQQILSRWSSNFLYLYIFYYKDTYMEHSRAYMHALVHTTFHK